MSQISKVYDALLERADDDTIELCLDDVLGVALGFESARSFYLCLTEFEHKTFYTSGGKFYISVILA